MSRRIARALAAGLTLLLAVAVGACGKAESGGSSSGGIKTGPGVTAKTITLGELTDLTAVFAALATGVTQSQGLYWKDVNANGGVCGRQVKVVVKDHSYDVQKGVSLYRDIEPDVAAVSQLVGSPIAAALAPTLKKDSMLTLLAAWPPTLLGEKEFGIIGASYDIEAINGLDWMMANKGLKAGDTIGDLYFEGDFGEGGLKGVKYAADKLGLKVVEQKIKATDTDMSSAAAAFKRAGVKAMWVTTGGTQLASVAGVAKSLGLDVPIGMNGPVFSPDLLKSSVGATLDKNATVFSSTAPYSFDNPAVKKATTAYEKAYPKGLAQQAIVSGTAEGVVMKAVLDQACKDKDLSREGLVSAFRELSAVDTGGLVSGSLDFSHLGEPSTKNVYALDVDKSAKGGLTVVGGGPLDSKTAAGYSSAG